MWILFGSVMVNTQEGCDLHTHTSQMKLSAFAAIAAVTGGFFLIPVSAEARPGKACETREYKTEPLEGFDCYLQRGNQTYSSHNSPFTYILNCSNPNDSYVISAFANGGKCPGAACKRELSTLIERACK